MNKGKSTYKFEFNAEPGLIDKIVKDWLLTNHFEFTHKYDEDLYFAHNAINGNRGFQYSITNNVLDIYAWTIGIGNNFFQLDSGAVNNMPGDSYKELLSGLFEQLGQYCNQVQSISGHNSINQQSAATFAETFRHESDQKKEKLCNIGFWLSIVGLILSFLGMFFGIIIYILVFYFASQGLKTKKRGKAIASIILSAISIIIVLIQLANL